MLDRAGIAGVTKIEVDVNSGEAAAIDALREQLDGIQRSMTKVDEIQNAKAPEDAVIDVEAEIED